LPVSTSVREAIFEEMPSAIPHSRSALTGGSGDVGWGGRGVLFCVSRHLRSQVQEAVLFALI
jgi:hypothetical protein